MKSHSFKIYLKRFLFNRRIILRRTHHKKMLKMEDPPEFNHHKDHRREKLINPLHHELFMSKKDWLRTYCFLIFILPIRVALLLTLYSATYMVAKIGLFNLGEKDLVNKPISTYWRNVMKNVIGYFARITARVYGLNVTFIGQIAPVDEAPLLVMAPHSSFFDDFLINYYSNMKSCVIAKHVAKNPIMNPIIKILQYIIVDRRDFRSKEDTTKEIMRRSNLYKHENSNERWPQIVFFPEGVYTNRKALMRFKNGAFNPGKPIQPVLIRYPNKIETVTYSRNNPWQAIWVTLCQPFTRVELEYLPVYYPNIEEQMDAEIFAANVRTLMATKLSIPLSELTFKEAEQQRKKLK